MKKIVPYYQSQKKNFIFILYLLTSLLVRFININQALFFTWDQGRDAFMIKKIVGGDQSLIGPTSGLQGFYLGPLWYYLGVPGYIIGGGNPYVFCYSYIAFACLALILFWIISNHLFNNKTQATICAFLLSLLPGSVWGSLRVWNPLAAIPLMAGALLALFQARQKRGALWLAFFLIGLTLQAEFAYAIFFIFSLFFLIPWIRQKFNILDFLIAGSAVLLTLIPQIIFELRNQFIMSKSLIASFKGEQITWFNHLSKRPRELFNATHGLLINGGENYHFLTYLLIFFMIVAIIKIFNNHKQNKSAVKLTAVETYKWKIMAFLAILPYPFYMLWKGNHGYFFDYYITSHFILLIPLFYLGIITVIKKFRKQKKEELTTFIILIVGAMLVPWQQFLRESTINPVNHAGLKAMDQAVSKIFSWMEDDQTTESGVIRIFTPNAETEHYDFIVHWKAKQHNRAIPSTVKTDKTQDWYILIEPDHQLEKRLNNWYKEATAEGQLTRKETIGDLTLESWKRRNADNNQ